MNLKQEHVMVLIVLLRGVCLQGNAGLVDTGDQRLMNFTLARPTVLDQGDCLSA